MRELVYLSERKLRQFQQEESRRRIRVREIGVPGVGQVGIEPSGDSHLADVIDHLSGIARWYQEDDLGVGDWVQFSATLGYTVLAPADIPPVLLFAEAPGDRRLILHGSPEYLLEAPAAPAVQLPGIGVSSGPFLRRMFAVFVDLPPGTPLRFARLWDYVVDPFDPDLAAPMTGYARITVAGHGAVVASPLFVAYDRQ